MKKNVLWNSVALGALLASGAAHAQDAQGSTDQADAPPEIVVTAQFRSQSLQSTPLAITAVNSAMLEARGQSSVADVAAQAPNVTLTTASQTGGSSMIAYIRGVGQVDSSYALEPGVGIYVDDVYYASLTGTMLDLLDVDRIEVLRGPQGTLAGKNSIGGAVKIYSSKPAETLSGSMQGTVGSYGRLDFKGSVSFPVAENLFVNIAGLSRNENGYVKRIDYACANPGSGLPVRTTSGSCKLGTEGGKSIAAGRIAMRWLPTDTLTVNLSADYTRDRSESSPNVITAFEFPSAISYNGVPFDSRFIGSRYTDYSTYIDPRPADAGHPWRPAAFPPINHLTAWGTSLVLDWNVSDTTSVKSITAYRKYTNDYSGDSGAPIPLVYANVQQRLNQISQELRLNSSFGSLIDYTIGGYYLRVRANQTSRTALPYLEPFGIDFDFAEDNRVPSSSVAGFVQATAHLTDQLDLIGGYRITHDKKTFVYGRSNPDGTAIQPPIAPPFPANAFLFGLDGTVGRYTKTRSDFRANLTYRWSPHLMTYAQFATGYKGGGLNPRANFPAQAAAFDPETLQAYEIGLKSDFLDRRVTLNLAAFFNKYKDIQLTVSSCPDLGGPGPCQAPRNAGNAEVKGFEAETSLRPLPGALIDASLSYLDFKYTSINPVTGVSLSDTSPYTAKWKASFGAQYEVALGSMGSLTPRLDLSYQSRMQARPFASPLTELRALTLLNARLTWRPNDGDLQVSGEVTNLTKQYYYQNLIAISGLGAVSGTPGLPRRFAVTVKKSF